jgi:hypothetical protein
MVCNLKDINVNIYDYVEQGTFLGEVKDETLYLVFKKDGQIIDYQKFFKNLEIHSLLLF